MLEVHVLRVFTDDLGRFGNPLGVLLDTSGLDDAARQRIAAELGFSETVFVDDVERAELRIFTPATELPLAGHPLVGTSWLLTQVLGTETERLRPKRANADVSTWTARDLAWIRARVDDAPPWQFTHLPEPADVTRVPVNSPFHDGARVVWAWSDEPGGSIRARCFAPDYGIVEDEATGSAALRLVAQLGRPIRILQGEGSVIYARPGRDPGLADIGGKVVMDEVRLI